MGARHYSSGAHSHKQGPNPRVYSSPTPVFHFNHRIQTCYTADLDTVVAEDMFILSVRPKHGVNLCLTVITGNTVAYTENGKELNCYCSLLFTGCHCNARPAVPYAEQGRA